MVLKWVLLGLLAPNKRTVSLSTTKAKTYAGVTCVQDMLYMKNVLESLGLKVKLPMVLEMDNQGAEYLANRTEQNNLRN